MALKNLKNLSQLADNAMNTKRKEVLTVSVNDVVSKKQVRKEFDELEGLAETMKDEGQQSPIIVSPKNSDGKYVIQKGERRWRALKIAGIDTIDIIINYKEQTRSNAIIGELIENMQRQDLKPLEEAQGIQDALDAEPNLTQAELARKLGKSKAYISQHLALLKMPACVRVLYDHKVTRDPETLNNLRQLFDIDPQRCESVCKVALENGVTRKSSRDIYNDAKEMMRAQEETNSVTDEPHNATANTNQNELHVDAESQSRDTLSQSQAGNDDSHGVNQNETVESSDVSGLGGGNSAPTELDDATERDSSKEAKKTNDWYPVNPNDVQIVVNVPTEKDVKEGVLLMDRACDNPSEVYVRLTGKNSKVLKVLASEIDLVSIKSL